VSKHWRKIGSKDQASIPSGPPHHAHNNTTTMQYKAKHKKIHTSKYIYTQWNGPSVTEPNPENCKNCSSMCAYDCAQLQYTTQHCTASVHNTTQNSSDNLSSYLRTSIIAQMLSIRGESFVAFDRQLYLIQVCVKGTLVWMRLQHVVTILFFRVTYKFSFFLTHSASLSLDFMALYNCCYDYYYLHQCLLC